MRYHPIVAFLRTNLYWLNGQLHFPRERVGETLTMEDGRCFVVFRQAVLSRGQGQPAQAGAIFIVRFHVAGMSPRQNVLFSWLPAPFFIGLPGFRAKLWMVEKATGDFQGLYEWDTVQAAENYARSYAMAFMTGRSVPGSVSHQIVRLDLSSEATTPTVMGDSALPERDWRRVWVELGLLGCVGLALAYYWHRRMS